MSTNLVIVESPAKAKSINKILGRDYTVRASLGHVRDLPQKKLAVDVKKGFEPEYELIPGRKKTVQELKAVAKQADKIYLAPDPDREGEAIAWHLMYALGGKRPDTERFYRVTYNEITPSAIRRAFAQPTRIDTNRVDAQQARRVLDRLVGYQVSPLLWRRIKGGSSAGRVQSVALRLICEREAEIRRFEPQEYWVFGARVAKRVEPVDPFQIRLAKINDSDPAIANQEQADQVRADLDQRELVVANVIEREVNRRTRPPFITSTLQQAASSALRFTPSRAMRIAQRLYEGVDFGDGSVGLITYMRTDSPAIAKDAQDQCHQYIAQQFGADYVPAKPNIFRSRSGAQEAHEAIRPTDVERTPEAMAKYLAPEELKLYRLIWKQFVASQMAPARIAQRTVEFSAELPDGATSAATLQQEGAPRTYLFRATASDILFPGFMKVTGEDQKKAKAKSNEGGDDDKEEADEPQTLPPLAQGEAVDCQEWLMDQKFTKPPPRYSEASLVRTLEGNGVGRPSTYAQIIQTLYARKYVEREKGSLRPTEPGEQVNHFLVSHLDALFDVQFTAKMEEQLDAVEEGKVEWTAMMERFYKRFQQWLKQAKGPDADQAMAARLLNYVEQVAEWTPPVKRGKTTYSDEKFVTSVRKQLEAGEKNLTMRQVEALLKLAHKYREQLPNPDQVATELGLGDLFKQISSPAAAPRKSTEEKLAALQSVNFDEPRKAGTRTYDDQVFCASLREQVEGGKRLSPNQLKYLDRLLQKYQSQIPEFTERAAAWGLGKEEAVAPEQISTLLNQLARVTEWRAPTKRGKREWSDEAFYQSLARQFKEKGLLSPKQFAALQKMAARYAPGKKTGAKAASADEPQ